MTIFPKIICKQLAFFSIISPKITKNKYLVLIILNKHENPWEMKLIEVCNNTSLNLCRLLWCWVVVVVTVKSETVKNLREKKQNVVLYY